MPMKVYYCQYSNWHHDPTPVLFNMHSDSRYTEGLNIRYLNLFQRAQFFYMILKLSRVAGGKFVYDGRMMYAIIKKYYPAFAKVAYRKYHTSMLTGVLVNNALSPVTPLMELYIKTENMIHQGTSNFMYNKAKNDNVVKSMNVALFWLRNKGMSEQEKKTYNPEVQTNMSQNTNVIPDSHTNTQDVESQANQTGRFGFNRLGK